MRGWLLPNWMLFVGVLVVNGLANALPIGGKTTGELSALYPNLFVPAGFAFAIWAVIYAAFAAMLVGLARDRRDSKRSLANQAGGWLAVSSIANMAWIVAWHHELVFASLLIMVVLLLSTGTVALRWSRADLTLKERLVVFAPIALYFGWITLATVANVTTLLVANGWGGFGLSEPFWAVTMVVVAAAIGAFTALRLRSMAYALPLMWGCVGIIAKRVRLGEALEVAIAAGIGIALLAFAVGGVRRLHAADLARARTEASATRPA